MRIRHDAKSGASLHFYHLRFPRYLLFALARSAHLQDPVTHSTLSSRAANWMKYCARWAPNETTIECRGDMISILLTLSSDDHFYRVFNHKKVIFIDHYPVITKMIMSLLTHSNKLKFSPFFFPLLPHFNISVCESFYLCASNEKKITMLFTLGRVHSWDGVIKGADTHENRIGWKV